MLLVFALCYLGMSGLALAMPRHFRQLRQHEPSGAQQRTLRMLGCAALAIGLGLCVRLLGFQIGLVSWFCLLMLGGLAVSSLLAWRERWTVPAGPVLVALGLLSSVA